MATLHGTSGKQCLPVTIQYSDCDFTDPRLAVHDSSLSASEYGGPTNTALPPLQGSSSPGKRFVLICATTHVVGPGERFVFISPSGGGIAMQSAPTLTHSRRQ